MSTIPTSNRPWVAGALLHTAPTRAHARLTVIRLNLDDQLVDGYGRRHMRGRRRTSSVRPRSRRPARSSIHIGPRRNWHVLDFSKAVHTPRLLDLAAWQGNAGPPDPDAIRTLIDQYVHAGGHRGALVDRGGLAPERWALGWRLVQDVEWALRHQRCLRSPNRRGPHRARAHIAHERCGPSRRPSSPSSPHSTRAARQQRANRLAVSGTVVT